MPGPYVIKDLTLLITLRGKDAVIPENDAGYGVQCVGLVKYYTNCPRTKDWVQGALVKNSPGLPRGTAIATFVNGVYPSHSSGNHACFFIEFISDGSGFTVLEQHVPPILDRIATRNILYADSRRSLTSNGNAYSVIL